MCCKLYGAQAWVSYRIILPSLDGKPNEGRMLSLSLEKEGWQTRCQAVKAHKI